MCDDLCRLCLSKENLMSLFANTDENYSYTNGLCLTTGLTIEANDGFPQSICGKCKEDLNIAFQLRSRSQASEIKLIELGFQKNVEIIFEKVETTAENEEIKSGLLGNYENTDENEADCHDSDGFPELKVEIECDRLEQDGGETKWPHDRTVRKDTRKEKRQQYLDLVDGEFDSKGPVKCKICKKTLSKWTCFISHAKLHLGFNFVCEFCGKSFISTTQLKRHCRSYHGMKRELPCKHCSYLALDNAQLKLHERRMHTFERPFICDECGASYHSRRCLVQHIESHRTVAEVQATHLQTDRGKRSPTQRPRGSRGRHSATSSSDMTILQPTEALEVPPTKPMNFYFIYAIDRGIIVIPKSVTKSRIIQNFNVFDFQLTLEDIKEIASLECKGRVCMMGDTHHPDYPFHDEY